MSRLLSNSTLTSQSLALEQATTEPLKADVLGLFAVLDQHLATLPLAEQLAEAGRWFAQLANLVNWRAELLLDGWHNKHHPTEPILSEEFLDRWVIHTQALDLYKWLDDPEPHDYPQNRNSPTTQIAVIEKEELLKWVDTQEAEPEVLQIPEDEDPTTWMQMLKDFWQGQAGPVRWTEMEKGVGLPPGALLLAVVLGDYPHYREPGTEFYENDGVWVQPKGETGSLT